MEYPRKIIFEPWPIKVVIHQLEPLFATKATNDITPVLLLSASHLHLLIIMRNYLRGICEYLCPRKNQGVSKIRKPSSSYLTSQS